MEAATRQHFFHHGLDDSRAGQKSCHWCQIRSFKTHKTRPVTIVNETGDGAVIPPDFRFLERSVFGAGVEPAADSFRSGCECADDQECMYSTCLCLEEVDEDDDLDELVDFDGDTSDSDFENGVLRVPAPSRNGVPKRRKKRFAYHSRGRKAGILRSEVLESRQPIYECHDGCRCSKDCPNRVVERGRQVPLQIFRTETRGWGVRSTVDIKRGQFVDCYFGEIITSAEAERRRAESDVAQRKDVYLFALDKFSDPDSLDTRLAGDPLECDGEYMSGPTRFINHSCEPNMRIFARVGDHADKHIHDLALFAVKDIGRGEELTFDYVDGLEEMESDAHNPAKIQDMTPCLCGSKRCRGFLW